MDARRGGGGVRGPAWEVLDRVTSLVDKSLVVADERAGESRYRFLWPASRKRKGIFRGRGAFSRSG